VHADRKHPTPILTANAPTPRNQPGAKPEKVFEGKPLSWVIGYRYINQVGTPFKSESRIRITVGPLFRPLSKGGQVPCSPPSGDAITTIVKRRVAAIGLDPPYYSGHSLRMDSPPAPLQLK
jgi:hypothetical protein